MPAVSSTIPNRNGTTERKVTNPKKAAMMPQMFHDNLPEIREVVELNPPLAG